MGAPINRRFAVKSILKILSIVLLGLAPFGPPVSAQSFPQRPIRIVVGFGPGSAADTVARILAERLSEQLKVSVVVDNREGAGSAIGTAIVAKAPADGYTLLLGATTMVVSPHMQSAPSFDPIKDFVPIVKVAEIPLMLIVGVAAPYKTLPELIAYAKANPDKLSYATSGKGSPSHLSVELIRQAMKIEVTDIPYKSVGQAMGDLIGGQVSFYFPAYSAALAQVMAGKARALAIGSTKRSPQLPNVPTLAEELGVAGLEVITWYGLLAPQGTPKEIVARLSAEVLKAMETPEVRERISKTGAEVAVASAEEFAAQMIADNLKYSKLVKALGLKE
jgi:tripartite-type tricarboxylate transporter receptor subunit TctC